MPDDTCHIEHCHNIEEKYGLCRTHYGRWWRYSDPYYVDDGYYQAHKRVRLVRGLPDAHECAGCGVKQASEWGLRPPRRARRVRFQWVALLS